MDSFNKKRSQLNEWCKKGFYGQAYDGNSQYSPSGAEYGSTQQSGQGFSAGSLAAPAIGAGTIGLEGRYGYKAWQAGKAAQTAGTLGVGASKFAAKRLPYIGAGISLAGAAFTQHGMNQKAKEMGGQDVYKHTEDYRQSVRGRNSGLWDAGIIGASTLAGAGIGAAGGMGVLSVPGAVAGAAIGATVGTVATVGKAGAQWGMDKYKQHKTGYNPENAKWADHLTTNTSGNAGDYAMALMNQRAGDYAGGENAHTSELASAYTQANRIK